MTDESVVMSHTTPHWCAVRSEAQYSIWCDVGDVCWWFPGNPLMVSLASMYISGAPHIDLTGVVIESPHSPLCIGG